MGRNKVTPPDPREAEKAQLWAALHRANPQAHWREITRMRNRILRQGWTLQDIQRMSLPDLRTVEGLGEVGALIVYRYAQQSTERGRQ
jgi:hypothetical protein